MISVCWRSLLHPPDSLVHIYLVNPIKNLAAGGSSYVDSDPEPASFVNGTTRPTPMDAPGLMNSATSRHIEVDYADERQAALRNNLMTKGLSVGRDLTQKQSSKVKSSKLVVRNTNRGQTNENVNFPKGR